MCWVSIEKTVGFARSSLNLRRQLLVALPKFRAPREITRATQNPSLRSLEASLCSRPDRLRSGSRVRSKPDAGDHRGQCAPTPRHRQTPEISAECAEAASRVRMVTASELRLRSPGRCSCCYCKHSDRPRKKRFRVERTGYCTSGLTLSIRARVKSHGG